MFWNWPFADPDAAAVTAKFEIPTMLASECVVCHKTLDPVASLFQDYWRFDTNFRIYGRRKDGWFSDMFQAGFEGTELPAEERWRALQWLGEQTIQDPRFARTMAGHAWFLLTGRRPIAAPKDVDDPLFNAKYRAFQNQQCTIDTISDTFVSGGYNFRQLIKAWILSDFYRADGLANETPSDEKLAELDEIGVVRMLSPEQLERKISAVFDTKWGRLNEQTAMLYGGIDSKEVTERATDPSGAIYSRLLDHYSYLRINDSLIVKGLGLWAPVKCLQAVSPFAPDRVTRAIVLTGYQVRIVCHEHKKKRA